MPQIAEIEELVTHKSLGFKHFARSHWLLALTAAVAALFVVECIVLALNWPFTKQDLTDVLQERSARSVTIGRFYRTYFPPGCVAEDIQFLHRLHKEKTPLITVRRLVMTSSWPRILTLQHKLTLVRIFDMNVTVPPSEPGQPSPVMPLTSNGKAGASVVIDRTIADGAVLKFLSKDPTKKPFTLTIDKLRLDGLGNNEPMFYRTIISNETPPGKIRSTGVFGTWNPQDPGNTPLHGAYNFDNANLAAFGGISGTLHSAGSFEGTLRRVNVSGSADIPDFKVRDTSHTRELTTGFQAVVDGIKGDTYVKSLTGHFDNTTVVFKGSVAGQEGQSGKLVSFDMAETSGRIEDLLDLFISAKLPPMTGRVTFRGHVDIPPGNAQLIERMRLQGEFGVGAGKFTDKETEADVSRLSESAEKHDKEPEKAETVLSDLKGQAIVTNGVAKLSHLTFTVPGAKANMEGTYNLVNYDVDLQGVLVTTGQPGDATTGVKSVLVKALSPFFKRKHGDKVVPFKITGNYDKPAMNLSLLNKNSGKKK
ncbi:MAG: hypothetical protein JO340_00545 [Acidobacteriaceae bacterium]|nr:hypothetical protein [Acidobacteriaceae bacterium]